MADAVALDVHTAVLWFFKWFPQESLPEAVEKCFNIMCFMKMLSYLNRSREELVFDADVKYWELRLQVANGCAFQKIIVFLQGNRCVICRIETVERRVSLALLNDEVKVPERLCATMMKMVIAVLGWYL